MSSVFDPLPGEGWSPSEGPPPLVCVFCGVTQDAAGSVPCVPSGGKHRYDPVRQREAEVRASGDAQLGDLEQSRKMVDELTDKWLDACEEIRKLRREAARPESPLPFKASAGFFGDEPRSAEASSDAYGLPNDLRAAKEEIHEWRQAIQALGLIGGPDALRKRAVEMHAHHDAHHAALEEANQMVMGHSMPYGWCDFQKKWDLQDVETFLKRRRERDPLEPLEAVVRQAEELASKTNAMLDEAGIERPASPNAGLAPTSDWERAWAFMSGFPVGTEFDQAFLATLIADVRRETVESERQRIQDGLRHAARARGDFLDGQAVDIINDRAAPFTSPAPVKP